MQTINSPSQPSFGLGMQRAPSPKWGIKFSSVSVEFCFDCFSQCTPSSPTLFLNKFSTVSVQFVLIASASAATPSTPTLFLGTFCSISVEFVVIASTSVATQVLSIIQFPDKFSSISVQFVLIASASAATPSS